MHKLLRSSNNSWALGRFAVIYKSLRSKTPVPGGSRLEHSNRIPDGSRLPVMELRIIALAASPVQAALVYSVDSPPRGRNARYLITAYRERVYIRDRCARDRRPRAKLRYANCQHRQTDRPIHPHQICKLCFISFPSPSQPLSRYSALASIKNTGGFPPATSSLLAP